MRFTERWNFENSQEKFEKTDRVNIYDNQPLKSSI